VVTVIHGDRTRDSTMEIVENGRGPKITSHLKVAPDHTLLGFDAQGHEEVGQPVDEHFFLEGSQATWKNTDEQGTKEVRAPSFYVPHGSDNETFGLLTEALIAAGGTLPLLPDGTARAEQVGEATVQGPNGATRHLVAWSVTGLQFVPRIAWIDDAGEPWGVVGEWGGIVPEGWEGAIDPLYLQVKAIVRRRDEALAQKLADKPPEAGLAITHARVLDVMDKKWLEDQTVVVKGTKIASVGPSAKGDIPAGAETIDAAGKALLPGLWDMHAHLEESSGPIYLAAGVTTVRDVGNDPDYLDDLVKAFDEGHALGPHVLKAGLVEGRGPEAAAAKITAETPIEARAAVSEYNKRGYVQMKIYNSVKPELVPIIAKEAHAKGMRVSGHVPVHMKAEEAVRAGYDEITHVNMLFLNFFADHETDTRTPLRFSLVAEKASGLDLASKPVKDFFALLRAKKTVVDPTLGVFENLFTDRAGEIGWEWQAVAFRVPPQVRRTFLVGGLPVPSGKEQTYKDALVACEKMVKALYDQKTPIVAGTDSIGGLALPRELELYVKAGIPAADVLALDTIGAARVMKVDRTTGSITVGKDADLVLVDGDPLKDVGDVRYVVKVVRGGVVYDSAPVFDSVGIQPASRPAP
jgi:imidazolonepropionase-like amidohydrolase